MEVTRHNYREGMRVDIKAIPWDDTPDDLNSAELLLAFKGAIKNVAICFQTSQSISFTDPTSSNYVSVKLSIVKSMTLASDWTGSDYEDDYDSQFGALLDESEIVYHSCSFYEKGMHIGCMTFSLKDIKKLYKELVKVYGEPK